MVLRRVWPADPPSRAHGDLQLEQPAGDVQRRQRRPQSASTTSRHSSAPTRVFGSPVATSATMAVRPPARYRAERHEQFEPAQFPNPLHTNTTNDTYGGELAWVVSPTFFVNTAIGYFGTDSFQVTDTVFSTELRHTFGASNTCTGAAGSSSCPFPEIPASLQQLNGYTDLPASTRNVRDKYGRFTVNVDGTYYANFAGSHTFKAGVQWERLSNDVLHRRAGADGHAELERQPDYARRSATAGPRRLRLLHRRADATPKARSTRTTSASSSRTPGR